MEPGPDTFEQKEPSENGSVQSLLQGQESEKMKEAGTLILADAQKQFARKSCSGSPSVPC